MNGSKLPSSQNLTQIVWSFFRSFPFPIMSEPLHRVRKKHQRHGGRKYYRKPRRITKNMQHDKSDIQEQKMFLQTFPNLDLQRWVQNLSLLKKRKKKKKKHNKPITVEKLFPVRERTRNPSQCALILKWITKSGQIINNASKDKRQKQITPRMASSPR